MSKVPVIIIAETPSYTIFIIGRNQGTLELTYPIESIKALRKKLTR